MDTTSQAIYNLEVEAKRLGLTDKLDDIASDAEDLTIFALNFLLSNLGEALGAEEEEK